MENSFKSTLTFLPQIYTCSYYALAPFTSWILGQSRNNRLCFWAESLTHLYSEQHSSHCLCSTPIGCLSALFTRHSRTFPEIVGEVIPPEKYFNFRKTIKLNIFLFCPISRSPQLLYCHWPSNLSLIKFIKGKVKK